MSPIASGRRSWALLLSVLLSSPAAAEAPTPDAVETMLRREPMTLKTWPAWRDRLSAWIDERGAGPVRAFEAAQLFTLRQHQEQRDSLPDPLRDDVFAWYVLGDAYVAESYRPAPLQMRDAETNLNKATWALRICIEFDKQWPHPRVRMAEVLIRLAEIVPNPEWRGVYLREAEQELREARRLKPDFPLLVATEGKIALIEQRYPEAAKLLRQAVAEAPDDVRVARAAAQAIERDYFAGYSKAPLIRPLVERFPDDGELACLHAGALLQDGDPLAAKAELDRARSLGTRPADVLLPIEISWIEQRGAEAREALEPKLLDYLWPTVWTLLGCLAGLAALMALMPLLGLLPARATRGTQACRLLGPPLPLTPDGQPLPAMATPLAGRLYALTAAGSWLLFHASLLLFLLSVVGLTLGLFQLTVEAQLTGALYRREAGMLGVLLVTAGGMAGWTLMRSLLPAAHRSRFGLRLQPADDCPRLHEVLVEMTRRLDTPPPDKVYLTPGAGVSLQLEGRGWFGLFGVARRVLVLGLASWQWLTVRELQALLTTQFAPLSRRGFWAARFAERICRCHADMLETLRQSRSGFTRVNPFFWLLYLYCHGYLRCVTCLSAGHGRAQTFRADRLAASLYGADVLSSALGKATVNAPLLEAALMESVTRLLKQKDAYTNMYEAFRNFRDDPLALALQERRRQELGDHSAVFAAEPTLAERLQALAPLPREGEDTPALELLEEPAEVERNLTNFLTAYLRHGNLARAKIEAFQREEELAF